MYIYKSYLSDAGYVTEREELLFKSGEIERKIGDKMLTFSYEDVTEQNIINVYPEITYQKILGFGGAITEASAYVYAGLSAEDKERFIKAYYGKDGLGYKFGRCSIDSCDFGLGNYSAKESPSDTMDMSRDEEYIIKLLSDIYKEQNIELFFAPWSPPVYMKSNQERNLGGKLLKEYYPEYAEYICDYLEEYIKRGFSVFAVDTQNEPNATQSWDSCIYSKEDEREFIDEYLYPEMERRGLLDVKRLIWDHNRSLLFERVDSIMKNLKNKNSVNAYGYHWYAGDHFENLRLLYEKYPSLLSVFTEGCIERLASCEHDHAVFALRYAHEIISCLNNGASIFIDWNILLDSHGGPNHKNNFCTAPVMTDERNSLVINPEYHAIGHFSKFIEDDAVRIAVSTFNKKVEATAWKNPNGQIVLAVANHDDETDINIKVCGKLIALSIPKESISTIVL